MHIYILCVQRTQTKPKPRASISSKLLPLFPILFPLYGQYKALPRDHLLSCRLAAGWRGGFLDLLALRTSSRYLFPVVGRSL